MQKKTIFTFLRITVFKDCLSIKLNISLLQRSQCLVLIRYTKTEYNFIRWLVKDITFLRLILLANRLNLASLGKYRRGVISLLAKANKGWFKYKKCARFDFFQFIAVSLFISSFTGRDLSGRQIAIVTTFLKLATIFLYCLSSKKLYKLANIYKHKK